MASYDYPQEYYKGWDQASAQADWQAKGKNLSVLQNIRGVPSGGSSDGGGGSNNQGSIQDQINKALENSQQRLQDEIAKNWSTYKTNNPFRIDDILAQVGAQAKEQIDPYYNETLSNYLTGVQNKIGRSTQDAQSLLKELNAGTESYTRDQQLNLNEAINRAGQGAADNGLYNSGARLRDQGLQTVQGANQLSDFTRGQEFKGTQIQNNLNRTLQDTQINQQQDVRNIERNRYTDTQTRASDLAKEQGNRFVTGFRATLPPEQQAASGFNLLQDLGIYS